MLSNFYQVQHNRLNKHTLSIVHAHVSTRHITTHELMELRFLPNTSTLLVSMVKNRQEESLEVMLEILHDLLTHFNDLVKTKESEIIDHIHEIFNNFESCIQLLSLTFDTSIVEKASQCLIQLLQLFAQSQLKQKEIYFVESHFPYFLSAIKSDKYFIQKRVLKCIYWALIQNEYTVQLPKDKIYQLESQMEQLMGSRDKSISNTSKQIYGLLHNRRQMASEGIQPSNNGAAAVPMSPLPEEGKYSAYRHQK